MTNPTEKWSDEFLLAKRQVADPDADRVVRYIIDHHEQKHLRDTWQALRNHGGMDYSVKLNVQTR